jgi:hypothetical protein
MNISSLLNPQPTAVTSTSTLGQATTKSLWSQLGQSLNSGNLAGAQATFATLKQNFEQNQAASGAAKPTGPLVSDVHQLSQALQSGNLSDAQAAFATLAQDAKNQGIYTAGTASSPSATTTAATGAISIRA